MASLWVRDIFVAFSPEREDPGRKDHSTSTIPKLVGGLDSQSTTLAKHGLPKGSGGSRRGFLG